MAGMSVGSRSQASNSQCSVTYSLDGTQMAQVSSHLHTIQSLTQSALLATPGGPELFNLVISGSRDSVERAQQLLLSVIQSMSSMAAGPGGAS